MAIDFAGRTNREAELSDQEFGEVRLRLIETSQRVRFDALLSTEHYLKNPTAVGRVLRYVAEYCGEWIALLVFASAAFHLKPRERWLEWSPRQLEQRRHLIAQNARFLILGDKQRWPNLASYLLGQACARLSDDWQEQLGHPVLLVETFVDAQRFEGTCYRAAGFVRLGATQGYSRIWRDFYDDTQQPKELFVRALGRRALRHPLVSLLTLIALAVCAGCQNPHSISVFAENLNHGQRRLLRCCRRKGTLHQYDVPGERTFRRLLAQIDPEELKEALARWMASVDDASPRLLHVDGKVVRNADSASPRNADSTTTVPSPIDAEIPPELQKPKAYKALTLVNVMTTDQRLVEQIALGGGHRPADPRPAERRPGRADGSPSSGTAPGEGRQRHHREPRRGHQFVERRSRARALARHRPSPLEHRERTTPPP